MTIVFYFLWTTAIVRIVGAPFFSLLKKVFFLLCVLFGIWLLIGVSSYNARRVVFEKRRSDASTIIDALTKRKENIEKLSVQHPNSLDVLFLLAQTQFYVGNQKEAREILTKLEKIHPNSQQVSTLKNLLQNK